MVSFRGFIFWLLDAFKGGKLKAYYTSILTNHLEFGSKVSIETRKNNLDAIISHALTTVPYYAKFRGYKSIENLPVIDKNIIKDQFSEFKSATYLNKRKIKVSTSGSTGVPFVLYQNKNKKLRNTADSLFFAKLANYNLGNKLIYFRAWDNWRQSKLSAFAKNIVMVNNADFTNDFIKRFLDKLASNSSSSIHMIGYPSDFEVICDYLDENQPEFRTENIISIITIGETLDEHTRCRLETYFSCPVLSRYSNNELGMLAQQEVGKGPDFRINTASYFIEILKIHEDSPVEKGEVGRIVVTDLFNYCMPIIRYDTGDLGKLSIDVDDDLNPAFSKIDGKKMDVIYDTYGKMISPHQTVFLGSYEGIKQYQFIQKGKNEYLCKLNILAKSAKEEQRILDRLLKLLGASANIKFEYVNEIPLLASGKRKKVVNEFYTSK